MNMNLDHIHEVWKSIADNVYGLRLGEVNAFDKACLEVPFSVNVTQSKDRFRIPHIDYQFESEIKGWAGVIYLNKGKECQVALHFTITKDNKLIQNKMEYGKRIMFLIV